VAECIIWLSTSEVWVYHIVKSIRLLSVLCGWVCHIAECIRWLHVFHYELLRNSLNKNEYFYHNTWYLIWRTLLQLNISGKLHVYVCVQGYLCLSSERLFRPVCFSATDQISCWRATGWNSPFNCRQRCQCTIVDYASHTCRALFSGAGLLMLHIYVYITLYLSALIRVSTSLTDVTSVNVWSTAPFT